MVYSLVKGTDNNLYAVILIPKCGTQSIQAQEIRKINGFEIRKEHIRCAFIRDPIDRLISAFCFFKGSIYCPEELKSPFTWETFIDWCLESSEDHIKPQYLYLYEGVDPKFDKLFPHGLQTEILGCAHFNSSERNIDINNKYKLDEIKQKYSNDFKIYNDILNYYITFRSLS